MIVTTVGKEMPIRSNEEGKWLLAQTSLPKHALPTYRFWTEIW